MPLCCCWNDMSRDINRHLPTIGIFVKVAFNQFRTKIHQNMEHLLCVLVFLGQNKIDVAHLQCSLDWAEWTYKLIWNSAAYLMTWWLTGVGSRATSVANFFTLSMSLFEGCDAQNGCGPLTPNTPLLHLTPKCALSLLDGGVLEAPKMLSWPILTHDAAV